MIYPTLVYICPGSHSYNGGTYDFIQVLNEEELNNKLKEGYYLTLLEAMSKKAFVEEHTTTEIKPIIRRRKHGVQK